MPPAETLEASARRIGHHAWIEQSLFETLGGWVTSTPEPAAKVMLAEVSLHHAWHAQLWAGLLPAVPHLSADDLVVPPAGDTAFADPPAGDTAFADPPAGDTAFADPPAGDTAFPDPPAGGSTADRLGWLCGKALPALLDRYSDHLARTTPVTDGPAIRVLGLVTADVRSDLDAGTAALSGLAGRVAPHL